MTNELSVPTTTHPNRTSARSGNTRARLLSFLLLLTLPAAVRAQFNSFSIADNSAAMSFAFDGSNYLVGLESPGPLHTIGFQMISATGTKVGSIVPTGRTGIAPTVAFDGTNYLTIWEDDDFGALTNGRYRVYGQFIGRAGTAVGAAFDVSGPGIQFDGIKPMAYGGGKYLVTYTRHIDAGGDSTRYIAGRIVNPDGTMESEHRISTGVGKASDVAFDGTNFFVVWCEDSLDREIRGRFVSPAGVPGTEISVNSSSPPSDNPNSVTFDGSNYLVVWNDEVGGEAGWDCFGQLVSTSGDRVGEPITITSEPGSQMVTSVAFDGANYLAVWVEMLSETNWDVYGQYISGNGSRIGSKLMINADTGNQLGIVGFANDKYLVLVASGLVLGEDGITQVESTTGMFIMPPAAPQIQTSDASFGVRTNRFGFNITGTSGSVIVVEACTNLASPIWFPVGTNTLDGESSYFSDPGWTNYPSRLYRLRSP